MGFLDRFGGLVCGRTPMSKNSGHRAHSGFGQFARKWSYTARGIDHTHTRMNKKNQTIKEKLQRTQGMDYHYYRLEIVSLGMNG